MLFMEEEVPVSHGAEVMRRLREASSSTSHARELVTARQSQTFLISFYTLRAHSQPPSPYTTSLNIISTEMVSA